MDRPIPADASRFAVGFATAGRRELLTETVKELGRQTRPPDEILICPATPDDVDETAIRALATCPVKILHGPRGLPAQRNMILAATEADLLVFFDDDFFMAPTWLEQAERLLQERADVLMLTGEVIADGAPNQGYDAETARSLLAADRPPTDTAPIRKYNAYGCNMAFKMAPVRAANLRFDEALPLYGWLEDVDFSRALVARGGLILRTPLCRGVHLGTKGGRTSGLRYGYSQIANPLHLARKGTMTPWRAAWQMAQNLGANWTKVLKPEPWVDRRGRVKGNFIGLMDLLRGRLRPQNILNL
ncbi:MAG: glycosyltransferase [Caulobacteraceae bacterium]|nr:glycosyltransferase [Caulobacteraceae bacterium]